MKSLKAVLAVGATAALTLSGCGGTDSSGGTPNAAPTDKVLHLSFLQDPGQPPDPDIYYAGQGLLLTTNTYEGLLQYKAGTEKPELEPLLATEWTASPDNKVFTLKLREGVKFHDGTPFTSAAVKASFDRRVAVNQGPAYMVTDVESVTTQGDYGVTITLKAPNSAFLDYLACPYGPRMLSPEGLKKNAGTDNAQGYLTTHDLGTGPYVLTAAEVGSKYALEFFKDYWGPKPYFEKVELPVITDVSAQQLQFNNGQLAAILHDLPSSAVGQYLGDNKYANYSLPTMMSNYVYINPRKGMMTDPKNRTAVLAAINVDELVKQTYFGRGKAAAQIYPPNVMAPEFGKQSVAHDPSVLTGIAGGLPADQKAVTIGYDSSNPDNQLISNLIQTQLAAAGLTAKVQAYPTSEIYGWVGSDGQAAPELMAYLGWPDAPSPYTWGHISWDADGGLNFFGCSAPPVTDALAKGLPTGSDADFSAAGLEAVKTGCWLNVADVNDFMVAQPWLKGVEQAHVVTNPNSLRLAALSGGLMATLVRRSGVRRIILLTLGWEELPKSVSVYGAAATERMREPVPGVLLLTDGGWVLLDTGFNTALVRDPALYRRFFPGIEYRPVLPGPGEPIEQRLAEVGVDFDAIHTVAVSHLHHDHSGGLKLFAGKVPVHAQRRELDYGLSNHPEPERHAIVRVDFDDPAIDWRLADGEAEVAPGLTAVPTYGHTPGHQSFVVDLDESVFGGDAARGYVFAFDAADLTENIDHELAIGGFIDVAPEDTVEPIRRLKKLAADKGYPLIPGHDPHVWPELTQHFHDRFGRP